MDALNLNDIATNSTLTTKLTSNHNGYNNEIQSSKGRGTPAVVIGLDNTNFYGAYVYRCGTYDGRPGRKLTIALQQDDMTPVIN